MKLPRITVITPSYNQGKFIERTITSVLNQRYPNLEYIVMDGGSTDTTLKILKKYSSQLIYFSEPDRGQTHAINKGLRLATGDIVAYLNSDDTYLPDTLQTVGQFFKTHPRAKFVYGQAQLIDEKDNVIGTYNSIKSDLSELHKHCSISQPTAFWRKKLHQEVGFFDESYDFTMDYEFWIRVAKKTKLFFLNKKTLAQARIHTLAKTSAFTGLLIKDALRVQKKHYSDIHHDWIFTYLDSMVHTLKNRPGVYDYGYYLVLILGSVILQLWWNKKAPTQEMKDHYRLWRDEIREKHAHFPF